MTAQSRPESVRCFIAVKLPSAALARLREAQDYLRSAEPGWKWVDPEMFHITLKFLGQEERQRLEALWSDAGAAARAIAAFQIALRGLGVFPNPSAPRVVWAGLSEGAAEMKSLAETIEETCSRHGVEPEKRPFAAHLTLGRARQPGPSPALAEAVKRYEDTEFGGGMIDRVLLMQSTLRRSGAVYTAIGEHALRTVAGVSAPAHHGDTA